jgi:uncharacterized protein (DUF433 family)
MRITVSTILKRIAYGMTIQELLRFYPDLEEEDIFQALHYAALLSSNKVKVNLQ